MTILSCVLASRDLSSSCLHSCIHMRSFQMSTIVNHSKTAYRFIRPICDSGNQRSPDEPFKPGPRLWFDDPPKCLENNFELPLMTHPVLVAETNPQGDSQ